METCRIGKIKKLVHYESKNYPTSYEDSCWNKDPEKEKYIIRETDTVVVYKDKYPACEGHLLFIPNINQPRFIGEALAEAYIHGENQIAKSICDGFNVGMNIGETAGQSVFWPHLHFIPRKAGDDDGIQKGIRTCYPKDAFNPKNRECEGTRRGRESRKAIEKMQKHLEAIGGKFKYD